MAALVEPALLVSLGVLALLRDGLRRLPLRLGQLTVVGLCGGIVAGLAGVAIIVLRENLSIARHLLLAMSGATIVLAYFELRSRAISPAQAEARLAALNARIRPHFLFNSLNAVLSLIRARPQQAEEALESLSDLFRAAMRDPSNLVDLQDEIDLGRQYLALEQLRLGERLRVEWQIDPLLEALPIPPLMLQPLLENAVYHGVEPLPAGGRVSVVICRQAEELLIAITNPLGDASGHVAGNQIALNNIRERLALYYDLEARLDIVEGADRYEVRIVLPCRRKLH